MWERTDPSLEPQGRNKTARIETPKKCQKNSLLPPAFPESAGSKHKLEDPRTFSSPAETFENGSD